jgi:predicted DNA-binding transcriptional regulator AlpA
MTTDEQYLRKLKYPEDDWALSDQRWYTASEVADKLGMSAITVRSFAARGEFPGAIQYAEQRLGWRIPRSGLITFIACRRRDTEQRQQDATPTAQEEEDES